MKFLAFYKSVLVLQNKYPGVQLATYSEKNLEVLWTCVDFLDDLKNYYAQAHIDLFKRATAAREVSLEKQTREQTKTLLDAVSAKLRYDAFSRAKEELAKRIFPGLKAVIFNNKDIITENEDEEEVLQRIGLIEAQWQKQKKYARYSAIELVEIALVMEKLKAYRDIIKLDIEAPSSLLAEPMRNELCELRTHLDDLLTDAFKQLVDAMLGRQVFIPAKDHYFIAFPPRAAENKIPPENEYEENVLAVTLAALTEVGLDSRYADAFRKQTYVPSVFVPALVSRFGRYIQAHGDEKQLAFAANLLIEKDWEQTEFVTLHSKPKMLLGTINLPIGGQGVKKELNELHWCLGELQTHHLDRSHPAKVARLAIDLFDQAGVAQFIARARPPCQMLAFEEYADPREVPLEAKPLPEPCVEPIPATLQKSAEIVTAFQWSLERLGRYVLGQVDKASRHSRQARAEYLVSELIGALTPIQTGQDKEISHSACCRVIALLFLHYQSIKDQYSELSNHLEFSLLCLLNAANLGMNQLMCGYKKSIALRPKKGCLSLFSAKFNGATKEADPVFLFLRDWIMQSDPDVCDILFEKTMTGDQEQYTYRPAVGQLLAFLKEKDGQETWPFSSVTLIKENFEEIPQKRLANS